MLILYTTADGKSRIQLRADREIVWLPQRQMAELFDVSPDNIGLHLKNIYTDAELSHEATAEESSVVQKEGQREVQRPLSLYNLDALITSEIEQIAALKAHKKGLMQQLFPNPEVSKE